MVVGVTVVVDVDPVGVTVVVGVIVVALLDPEPVVIVVVGTTVVVLVDPEPVVIVVVGVTVVVDVDPEVLLIVTVLVDPGNTFTVIPSISMYVQPYKQYWKLTRLIGISVGIVQL